jgi:predicted RNA-binding protein YlxR (DUF448 family)
MLARAADTEDTDAGPRQGRGGTERLCAVTRVVRPIDELIRFVVGPDGSVVADLKRRLPGRGVWVTAKRAVVDDAVKRNAFARSLKRDARAAADLGATLDRQLENAVLDALAMVHKAGRVAIGFAKTETALADKPVAAILTASDGSADGARKIAAAVGRRQTGENPSEIPIIAAFTSAQLDLAFGRSNVVHAALLAGPASNGFLARCQSLERFRSIDPDGRDGAARG